MKILSITLIGYRRLHLTQINFIKLIPVEKMQLILGTNGSGKSSLMRELTPLPANAQDFSKDGMKEIIIEHMNSRFVLMSKFSPTQRHSFLKDDVEMNQGGTLTVQKELVKREFGITPDIHELLLGQVLFTKMGPGERRSWFTRLSDTNYTYAIGVYQKLKEKHRDLVGAIKLNQARSVQEANKMLSEAQETTLRNEILKHQELISHLLSLKTTIVHFANDVETQAEKDAKQISLISNQIIKLRSQFLNVEGFKSIDEIQEALMTAQVDIQQIEYRISLIAKELESQQQLNATLVNSNVSSLKEVDNKITAIHQTLSKYKETIDILATYGNFKIAFQTLNGIHDNLVNLLTVLPKNVDRQFSKENYQKLIEAQQLCQQKEVGFGLLNARLLAQKKLQEEAKQAQFTECPKCSYQWQQGYSENTYQEILSQLFQLSKDSEDNSQKLKTLTASIEETKEYLTYYRTFSELTKGASHLNPLWEHIFTSEIIFNNPSGIIYLLESLKQRFIEGEGIERLKDELSDLLKLKLLTEQNEAEHVLKLQQHANILNESLFKENEILRNTKGRVNTLKNYIRICKELDEGERTLESLIDKQSVHSQQLIESLRQRLLNTMIRDTQLELTKKEQQLSQVNIQKALVDSIQKQIAELEIEAGVLKLMVKELSPTDGLIAKGLLGFINSFVQQVNSFIRKVWLYPLEIISTLPNEEDGIDLDYKFSMRVNNKDVIPDIKLASSAMSEIIDLAFRIVAMKYLGLSQFPIGLDELGHSLDHAHKISIFEAIRDLILRSDFSQVFLISHFDECYGSLANVDITVLCSKNIVLPKNCAYNAHTLIQ